MITNWSLFLGLKSFPWTIIRYWSGILQNQQLINFAHHFWAFNEVLIMISDQRSISPTFYEQLLHTQIPKAQKRQSSRQSFFAFMICERKSCSCWWNWHLVSAFFTILDPFLCSFEFIWIQPRLYYYKSHYLAWGFCNIWN